VTAPVRPWVVFSATSVGVVIASLNVSMVAVALPALVADLGATSLGANWILLSYMVVTTVLILSFGSLSDHIGRRRVFVAGMAVFAVCSLACALSTEVPVMIVSRIGQAIGAAAVITNSTALLVDVFPKRTVSLALGYNLAVASAANALGPLIAGLLVTLSGWRWVFGILVPLGVVGFAWAWFAVPRDEGSAGPRRYHAISSALLFLFLGTLLFVLSDSTADWSTPAPWAYGGTAIAAGVLFFVVQVRSRHPLLDLDILRNRARALGYSANFFMSTGRFVVVILASLYIQGALDGSALDAGYAIFPLAAGLMVGSGVSGWWARVASARLVSSVGCFVCALGMAVLIARSFTDIPIFMQLGLVLVGLGNGVFMTPNTAEILGGVLPSQRGVANGLRSMLQNTGQTVSTALALAVLTAGLSTVGRNAVFSGRLTELSADEIDTFVGGFRAALALLLVLALVAATLSIVRGPGGRTTQPDVRPVPNDV
jgi:EmrB/QacA subfamily drug resistance transporter